jgi:hypothetical protein
MTKNELKALHAKQCVIKKTTHLQWGKPETRYVVSFSLSKEELMVMKRSLGTGQGRVGLDLKVYLARGMEKTCSLEELGR